MFTTRDLPESFRAAFTDADTLRAVRRSGLRMDLARCEHGRTDCPPCVIDAARQLVADSGQPVT